MKKQLIALTAFAAFICISSPRGHAQEPFYKDKTITIIAGSGAGNVYDIYARWFAKHLPKYIPGNPNMIVQNMPGAASMIAANYLSQISKPDGLTIGAIFPALYFDQLIGRSEVKYDWSKFIWLGSPVKSEHLLYMRGDTRFKTLDDVVKASPAPKCGATGTTSTAFYIPKLLDETIGTNFEIILGYQTGTDIDLAVERNEVVCRAFTITAFFAREPFFTWRKNGFVRVLLQTGRKRDARIKDTPTIYEFLEKYKTNESGMRLSKLILAGGEFGRPYVLPPKTPASNVKIIREAFAKVMQDENAIAEAKGQHLEIDPSTAEELDALSKEVIDQPPEIIARMKKLLSY
ncbi:MAG: tripartite tricarboxylate transporter substrate-binding protein [Deltaproteobacteria bacterium]|nr:tripartite tricarboxylate transporter substrate-binding protein [Deltaproteobacteria bacterium]